MSVRVTSTSTVIRCMVKNMVVMGIWVGTSIVVIWVFLLGPSPLPRAQGRHVCPVPWLPSPVYALISKATLFSKAFMDKKLAYNYKSLAQEAPTFVRLHRIGDATPPATQAAVLSGSLIDARINFFSFCCESSTPFIRICGMPLFAGAWRAAISRRPRP
jgi:hypothetical protein